MFTIFEEEHPFIVTWFHYLQLMRIENAEERSFYEIEAAREKWGVRDLSRQYNSSLYERLALSRDVDLVFYNRLLKCFVLFDLKIGKLKHQDLGQMQMYVNYYDRYEKTEEENPTIGVLLCNEKNDAMRISASIVFSHKKRSHSAALATHAQLV